MEIVVNYQCWSCGQEWSVWEDRELPLPVPEITIGTICKKCLEGKMKIVTVTQKTCPDCEGKGYIVRAGNVGRGLETLRLWCKTCEATGIVYDEVKGESLEYDPAHCFCGKDHTVEIGEIVNEHSRS